MRRKRFSIPVTLLSVLLVATFFVCCIFVKSTAEEYSVNITVLQTSDIHGMINPYNYINNTKTNWGMAHIATIVKEERIKDPKLLLVDTGDTSQNNYLQYFRAEKIHPAVKALNYLDYDLWTPGNHEFNYEFKYLEKQIEDFKGKIIMGNAYTQKGERWQKGWHIFEVKGVRVAIFGITAPHIPMWEKENKEHYNYMTFTQPIDEVGKILDELENKADVIIGNIHYGLEGTYKSKGIEAIAKTYAGRIDGLLIGHAHKNVDTEICGIPVLEPGKNGRYIGKLVINVNNKQGKWTVNKDKSYGELIDVSLSKADHEFLNEFKELHQKSLALAYKNK